MNKAILTCNAIVWHAISSSCGVCEVLDGKDACLITLSTHSARKEYAGGGGQQAGSSCHLTARDER
eukprot:scaffold215260_cov27-Prasinocladus_malaysianus.AAC.1